MNVYEEAHRLAQAIKESEEHKQFMALKQEIDKKPELSQMLDDFQKKQMELQAKQLMGEEVNLNPQSLQELYQIIARDPMAASYLQAQMRFSVMMNDVYKILADVMGLGNLV